MSPVGILRSLWVACVVFLSATICNAFVVRMGVEPEDVSGKRLWVKFSAFGFGGRTCQLELRDSGDCIFSKGMVTVQPGAWRIEEEQGQDYLQFTCPLTELYSEIFDIPSSLLFWRVPMLKETEDAISLKGGLIISEKKAWFGLKTDFIDEGNFEARVLADDEEFPEEPPVDLSKIEMPKGLTQVKKLSSGMFTGKQKGSGPQVLEPPLPADLIDME